MKGYDGIALKVVGDAREEEREEERINEEGGAHEGPCAGACSLQSLIIPAPI